MPSHTPGVRCAGHSGCTPAHGNAICQPVHAAERGPFVQPLNSCHTSCPTWALLGPTSGLNAVSSRKRDVAANRADVGDERRTCAAPRSSLRRKGADVTLRLHHGFPRHWVPRGMTGPARQWRWARRALTTATTAVVGLAAILPVAQAKPEGPASSCRMPAGTFETVTVPSSMGPVPVQIQWARHCGSAALYLLDGLRARPDVNAWTTETGALHEFAADDVTLVMPIGGPGSWYADWTAPTVEPGRGRVDYRWETFLAQELPAFLEEFGVSATRNAVVGLSMSGSAALALAAHHRQQFVAAASFSGALDWHTSDMREAIRAATWQAGHNPDAMATPGTAAWDRLDPYRFAALLAGLPMYIAAAPGIPTPEDRIDSAAAAVAAVSASALEMVTAAATHQFQARLDSLGISAVYDFPPSGMHNWHTWDANLQRAHSFLLSALSTPES